MCVKLSRSVVGNSEHWHWHKCCSVCGAHATTKDDICHVRVYTAGAVLGADKRDQVATVGSCNNAECRPVIDDLQNLQCDPAAAGASGDRPAEAAHHTTPEQVQKQQGRPPGKRFTVFTDPPGVPLLQDSQADGALAK